MIINIIVKENEKDKFDLKKKTDEIRISLISLLNETSQYPTLKHDIRYWLNRAKLTASDNVVDFCNLSLAVYNGDTIISRSQYGFYNWSRYFKIFLPVVTKSNWDSQKEKLENILSFLTGDKWELYFRERNKSFGKTLKLLNKAESVCLLSGGLDSFIGAIDLMHNGKDVVFVSHHKKGNAGEMNLQSALVESLKAEYKKKQIQHFTFYVQSFPDKNKIGESEPSQRARSILFIALGLLVANSSNPKLDLIVPENGFISLNVPLTKTRLGSFSTKTTHPKYITALNNILYEIGIHNHIKNPYSFLTKGEMLKKCRNKKLLKNNLRNTISCSKPGNYMQWYGETEKHCGHCTPCIIRQASVYEANLMDFDCGYVYNDIINNPPPTSMKSGWDIQAFKIGIERAKQKKNSLLFNLLLSGDLPSNSDDLKKYLDVYRRGIFEVDNFFKK